MDPLKPLPPLEPLPALARRRRRRLLSWATVVALLGAFAAGAFHVSKPSDLIPEIQGRFPIRVELESLSKEDFIRILQEPRNALLKQYAALLETEGLKVKFEDGAVEEIAEIATKVNLRMQNIGARRLHTVMEKLLEEASFNAPDMDHHELKIDAAYVKEKLEAIIKDEDLSKYIL